MSNDFSADNFKFPGDDARLDIIDLFLFKSPDHRDKTVLIMDSNPSVMGPGFHSEAGYRIHIDTDGDAHAEATFTFTLPEPAGEVIASVPAGFDARRLP
jgi:hypothetical protein